MITLSSDSEEDDSDVEIIAQYSNFLSRADPLPQQDGKVCVNAPNVNAPVVRLHHGLLQLYRNLYIRFRLLLSLILHNSQSGAEGWRILIARFGVYGSTF